MQELWLKIGGGLKGAYGRDSTVHVQYTYVRVLLYALMAHSIVCIDTYISELLSMLISHH